MVRGTEEMGRGVCVWLLRTEGAVGADERGHDVALVVRGAVLAAVARAHVPLCRGGDKEEGR